MTACGYGGRVIESFELGRNRKRTTSEIGGDLLTDLDGFRITLNAKESTAKPFGTEFGAAYRNQRVKRPESALRLPQNFQNTRRKSSAGVQDDRARAYFLHNLTCGCGDLIVLGGDQHHVRCYFIRVLQ